MNYKSYGEACNSNNNIFHLYIVPFLPKHLLNYKSNNLICGSKKD